MLAAGWLAVACITPSIPIPPPDASQMTFSIDAAGGTARFSYPPDPRYVGSTVFVYDRNRGRGIIEDARPDGSVGPTAPFAASLGDAVVVTFQQGDQTASTCIVLREGTQSQTAYCP